MTGEDFTHNPCPGCGKPRPHEPRQKCEVCKEKLALMAAVGYLQDVPGKFARTVFSDERGRTGRSVPTLPKEDNYDEESKP